jgi:tRNA(Ile)-lysidine synthase
VDLTRLFAAGVVVRSRRGGERLRPRPDSPTRALKQLLREAALAPWERAAVPLVFAGGALAVVPGVAVDSGYHAVRGARSGALVWSPHPGHRLPQIARGGALG